MNRFLILILLFSGLQANKLFAQVVLNADGPGDTYELINSVLAPNYDVVEVPDCGHLDFGRHIEEVMDSFLDKYVFKFYIHKTPDNDRCINFDRQRNEIKTYDKSPANLKAVIGERVVYSWKFKIDSGFQSSSSFTHLHQIKAVGGSEESMPLITLTARKGSPDKLEIRYAEHLSQTTIHQVTLEPFKGNWVEVEEIISFAEQGKYSVNIHRLSDSLNLLTYNNDNIRMWKTDASFQRPKWGIYRSLNDSSSLRDEAVYFSDFLVEELDITSSKDIRAGFLKLDIYPNPASDYLSFRQEIVSDATEIRIFDQTGRVVLSQPYHGNSQVNISHLEKGIYFVKLLSPQKSVLAGARLVKW